MFLRKDGTNRTYNWTPALSRKHDMVQCPADQVEKYQALFAAEQIAVAARNSGYGIQHGKAAPSADPFEDLDDNACLTMATKFKISFPEKATLDEKRNILREVSGKIEESKSVGTLATLPIPEQVQVALGGTAEEPLKKNKGK